MPCISQSSRHLSCVLPALPPRRLFVADAAPALPSVARLSHPLHRSPRITNVNSAHEAYASFKSGAETNGGPPATFQPEQVDAPTDQSATKENNNYKEATEAHLQNIDPAPRSGFGVTGLGIVRGGPSFRGAPLHRGGRGRAFATCVSRPANTASEQPTLQFAAQTTTTTDTETGPDRTASPASASPVPVSDGKQTALDHSSSTANVFVNGGSVRPGDGTAPFRSRGHSLLTPRGGTGRGAATALRPAFNTQSTIGENYKEPASAILNTVEADAPQPPVASATGRGAFSSGRAGFSRGAGIAARPFATAQPTIFGNNQALQSSDQNAPGAFSNVQLTTDINVHEPPSAERTPSAVSSGYSEPDDTNVRQESTQQPDQSASSTTASTDTSSRGGGHGARGFRVAFGAGRSATGRGGSSTSASTFAAVQEQRTERNEEVIGTQQNITTSFSATTEATATCSVGFANTGFGSAPTAAPTASATTTSSFGAAANVTNTFARGLSSAPRGSRGGRGGIFGVPGGFTANTQSTQNVGVLENTGFGATISATPKSSTDVVTTVDATVTDTGAPGATNAFSGGISPLSSRGGRGGGFGRGGSFTANTQSTQNVGVFGSTGFGATISETPRSSTDVVTTVDASVTDTAAPGATGAFPRGGISGRGNRGGRGGGFGTGGGFAANSQTVGCFGNTGFGATNHETHKASTDVVTTVDASVTDTAAPGATNALPRGGISVRGSRGGRGGGFGQGGGFTANDQNPKTGSNVGFIDTTSNAATPAASFTTTSEAVIPKVTGSFARGANSVRGSRGGHFGSSSSAQVVDLSAQFAGSAANSHFGNGGFGGSASGARSGEGAPSGSASSEFERHDPTDRHNNGFATTEKAYRLLRISVCPLAGHSLASLRAGFLKQSQDVITAKRSELFGNLHGPLGCIYEPGTKQWIVTDTDANNVRLFDPRDNKGGLRVWQDNDVIRHPSALALLEAGQSFVVLDNNGIWEHDLRNQQLVQRVAFSPGGGRMGEYRGLVVTADHELVTTRRTREGTKILVFSNEASAEVVAEINYEVPRTPGSRGPNPCFMDCMQDRICITDLGTGGLTVYQYEKQAGARRTMTPVVQLMCKAEGGGRQDGKFQFISGVRLDENAEMWVCDAQGFSIQWLDQQGHFRSRLHFDDGFCYCSGFALNVADSQLLACDRKRNVAKLYDINSSPSGPVQNKTFK
ncbi:hypothetical protein AAVH_06535 [Aphelenchoides avenae]|nr:hypothetical protein AAVH_06535 [Aphelenchus avenae]